MSRAIGLGNTIQENAVRYPFKLDATAVTLMARFTTPPTTRRAGAINNLVKALKLAGTWTKFDLLYVLAAADTQAALLNWASTSYGLTPVNAPTFAADRGYTGNGTTQELTTGFTPSTQGVQLARDSAHIGAYALTAGATAGYEMGEITGVALNIRARSNANGGTRVNGATSLNGSGAITFPAHFVGIRRASTDIFLHRNGVQNTTAAVASTALTTSALTILRASTFFSDRQIAIAHVGAALSDAEALATYAAFNAYLVDVGAA